MRSRSRSRCLSIISRIILRRSAKSLNTLPPAQNRWKCTTGKRRTECTRDRRKRQDRTKKPSRPDSFSSGPVVFLRSRVHSVRRFPVVHFRSLDSSCQLQLRTSHDRPAYCDGQLHCSTSAARPRGVLSSTAVVIDTDPNLRGTVDDITAAIRELPAPGTADSPRKTNAHHHFRLTVFTARWRTGYIALDLRSTGRRFDSRPPRI